MLFLELTYCSLFPSHDRWGHARDYVKGMWSMLQQDEPDDYILATGIQTTIRQFLEIAFKKCNMNIVWDGNGINEKGYINNKIVVDISPKYFRPIDCVNLVGNPQKALSKLNWKASTTLNELIYEMVFADISREKMLKCFNNN